MELLKKRLQVFYNYRFLIKQLVVKDIKLKYRRSFLGYLWSVLNPLLTMLVMVIVFSHMFRFNIEYYPAYLIIGQTLFNFMSEATNQAITSITGNAALLKKVYVPKYVFTLSKVTSSLVNLLFSMAAMIIVFLATRVPLSLPMLMIPVILLETYLFSLGFGLFLAQASVFFRDIQYIYGVFMTAWMYLTPIFYPLDQLPVQLQYFLLRANPMCNYIVQFRRVVLEQAMPARNYVLWGFFVAFFFMWLGTWSFTKTQDKFILYI
ncbi:MAG: ABC transporter permease [Eubacterium sp.]|nr:ABC transporter permease [Eubacterium sp.]